MVAKISKTKKSAKIKASKARRRGLEATVYKKKKGYGISITRMGKKKSIRKKRSK